MLLNPGTLNPECRLFTDASVKIFYLKFAFLTCSGVPSLASGTAGQAVHSKQPCASVSALLPLLLGSPGGVTGQTLSVGCRVGVLVLTLTKDTNLLISVYQNFVCILQCPTSCCVTAAVLLTHSLLVLPLPRCVEQWSEGPFLCAHLLAPAAVFIWVRFKTVPGILHPLTQQT